ALMILLTFYAILWQSTFVIVTLLIPLPSRPLRMTGEWVQWVLVGSVGSMGLVSSDVFFVILNAVKNLSVRVGGGAIPEIL
ncbi:MAG: hypothetical protein UHS52_01400, partial [Alistipes sp.]|nr:hypothetical protein [Alistipes sp.]